MPSIFSKIIVGEIPCHRIAETADFLAFLDIMPVKMGHVLVVPKKETDFIFDMEDTKLGEMMIFAKKVAHAIRKTVPCKRVGVTVIGLEVPHAHIHLIPIDTLSDMDFTKKITPSQEALTAMAEKVRNNF